MARETITDLRGTVEVLREMLHEEKFMIIMEGDTEAVSVSLMDMNNLAWEGNAFRMVGRK